MKRNGSNEHFTKVETKDKMSGQPKQLEIINIKEVARQIDASPKDEFDKE
jgi:hypothetical protein